MTADEASNLQDTRPDEDEQSGVEAPGPIIIHGTAHLSATSQTEVGE